MALAVTFFGTRGSIPSPGPGTVRYGGNTPSLLLEHPEGRLVLDAGSGLRLIGRHLEGQDPLQLTVLLSHTHWDHIQGLPFFRPLYASGNRIRILGPRQAEASLESIIAEQMAPAVFPVPINALGADVTIAEITDGEFDARPFRIRATALCHPAPTLGYAVSVNGGESVAYLPDNELGRTTGPDRRRLVDFLAGARILIHDAMYFSAELGARRGWGHSSAPEAVALAAEAGVGTLVLFHHDPEHDDDALERLAAEARTEAVRLGAPLDVILATEGRTLRCE